MLRCTDEKTWWVERKIVGSHDDDGYIATLLQINEIIGGPTATAVVFIVKEGKT